MLRGELELADRPGRSREELAAAVRSAAAEADRLARITSDLLLLARSDEDRLSLRLEQTELRPLLARSAELARPRLAEAGLTCRVDVPAGPAGPRRPGLDQPGGRQPAGQRAALRAPRVGHRARGPGQRHRY